MDRQHDRAHRRPRRARPRSPSTRSRTLSRPTTARTWRSTSTARRVSETPLTGAIRTTDLPLLVGQRLPADAGYNFPGTLDDVRVYSVALTAQQVSELYTGTVAGEDGPSAALGLGQPFPNPARARVTVPLTLGPRGDRDGERRRRARPDRRGPARRRAAGRHEPSSRGTPRAPSRRASTSSGWPVTPATASRRVLVVR